MFLLFMILVSLILFNIEYKVTYSFQYSKIFVVSMCFSILKFSLGDFNRHG